MASEEEIERIARQLCIAAGKDPIASPLLRSCRPILGNGCSFGPFALWHPITNAPENMEDPPYIVSDGTLEKALWNTRLGTELGSDAAGATADPLAFRGRPIAADTRA